jgi:hypothetical protein
MQHDTERIHIARSGNDVTAQLLRARVLGRKCHQSMAEALPRRQIALAAILVDGLSLDEVHDQIRQALIRTAAIENPRNVGMIETREQALFRLEALEQELAVVSRPQNLDGHFLVILIIGTDGTEDFAHPPAAQLPDNAIRTQAAADPTRRWCRRQRRRQRRRPDASRRVEASCSRMQTSCSRALNKITAVLVSLEQRFNFRTQLSVIAARAIQKAGSVWHFQGRGKHFFDTQPAIHAHWPLESSRFNQARASVHSRLTVASEMSSARAVSSMVMPPKYRI